MSDAPRPGYWLCKLVKGGPLVPCAIELRACPHEPGDPGNVMERSPVLVGFIAGEEVHPSRVPWQYGNPISAADYRYRLANAEWAMRHAPDEPIAKPREKINLMAVPLPW